MNRKEAEFVTGFTCYMIQQGYKPENITILSLYSGQLLHIRKIMRNNNKFNSFQGLLDVRVQTVDNFQGEENDIIIISLVRSNKEKKIGFLKISNRVNVALSRARHGLFIFGNAECLRDSVMKLRD